MVATHESSACFFAYKDTLTLLNKKENSRKNDCFFKHNDLFPLNHQDAHIIEEIIPNEDVLSHKKCAPFESPV
jgi:hypothetical protein